MLAESCFVNRQKEFESDFEWLNKQTKYKQTNLRIRVVLSWVAEWTPVVFFVFCFCDFFILLVVQFFPNNTTKHTFHKHITVLLPVFLFFSVIAPFSIIFYKKSRITNTTMQSLYTTVLIWSVVMFLCMKQLMAVFIMFNHIT